MRGTGGGGGGRGGQFTEAGEDVSVTKDLAAGGQDDKSSIAACALPTATQRRVSANVPQIIQDAVIEQDSILRHNCHGGSQ